MAVEDEIQEFVVTGSNPFYNQNALLSKNFLKSSKFAVMFTGFPEFLDGYEAIRREMTLLCDSVEFPGQNLTALDYRIPGKFKLKVPYLRDLSEITLTFYYSDDVPIYNLFSDWISGISPTNTTNKYFNECVCPSIKIYQFNDLTGFRLSSVAGVDRIVESTRDRHIESLIIDLKSAYPLNFTSMPANWGDDGFHKMTVSFFYEDIEMTGDMSTNFSLEEVTTTARRR